MKVFLDTNVLASAFATRGLCADLLREILAEHELVTGEVVLEELERVLKAKFRAPDRIAAPAIQLLRGFTVVPKPTAPAAIKIRDPDDAWVLASALDAGAEVLVTGDSDLLSLHEVEGLRILSPRAFWELLRESPSR